MATSDLPCSCGAPGQGGERAAAPMQGFQRLDCRSGKRPALAPIEVPVPLRQSAAEACPPNESVRKTAAATLRPRSSARPQSATIPPASTRSGAGAESRSCHALWIPVAREVTLKGVRLLSPDLKNPCAQRPFRLGISTFRVCRHFP